MFGSNVLDVSIGLVLSYLLITLMLTSVVEAIEAWRKRRALGLEVAIAELVDDRSPQQDDRSQALDAQVTAGLRTRLYRHPLVYSLYCGDYHSQTFESSAPQAWWARRNLPAYIPRDTFATALVDLMDPTSPNGAPDSATTTFKKAWAVLDRLAGSDADKMRAAVANWYDAAMERAASRYKRRTQKQLFWLGLAAALAFNVNSVIIATVLDARTPAARSAMIDAAKVLVAVDPAPATANGMPETAPSPAAPTQGSAASKPTAKAKPALGVVTTETVQRQPSGAAPSVGAQTVPSVPKPQYRDALATALEASNLPIGWEGQALAETRRLLGRAPAVAAADKAKPAPSPGRAGPPWLAGWLLLAAGYLMTAFAATLGSPFWFDLLGRFVNIRSAMKPSESRNP
ncbi:MAG TPA: hypothetical protein VF759_09110 [Allosphingosinicella sp.]|jgi:hypothetical protein